MHKAFDCEAADPRLHRQTQQMCMGACCLLGGPLCIYHFKLSSCCISQQAGVGWLPANPSVELMQYLRLQEQRCIFLSLSLCLLSSPHVLYSHYAPMYFLCLPQMHYAEGEFIFRQGAAGDTFYIISKGQVKFLAHYRDATPALFWKWSLDRSLFSPLHFFFIFSLSFQWTIYQVKVMEKKSGQEEPAVLSRLTERQWFGEKALWGWGEESFAAFRGSDAEVTNGGGMISFSFCVAAFMT